MPEGIEAVVLLLPLSPDAILLNAQGIGREYIGAMVIVEGVKMYSHAVIALNVFLLGHSCPNPAGFVPADKDHVKIMVVVR